MSMKSREGEVKSNEEYMYAKINKLKLSHNWRWFKTNKITLVIVIKSERRRQQSK